MKEWPNNMLPMPAPNNPPAIPERNGCPVPAGGIPCEDELGCVGDGILTVRCISCAEGDGDKNVWLPRLPELCPPPARA